MGATRCARPRRACDHGEASAQAQFVHPAVVRLLQPIEERVELAQAAGTRHHQVDELVVVGQQVLRLGDRLAEQAA